MREFFDGLARNHGIGGKPDLREPMTADVLSRIADIVYTVSHDERCLMAVAVITFVCCTRIGETVVTPNKPGFLRRKDWDAAAGEISVKRTKTDRYGRGTTLQYVKMDSNIDPVHWMNLYAQYHERWSKDYDPEEPLFMKLNSEPVHRRRCIFYPKEG